MSASAEQRPHREGQVMSAMQPMKPGSKFIVLEDDRGPNVCMFHDGDDIEHEVAWSPVPESGGLDDKAVKERFRWLVEAAAKYHEIPVETEIIK